MTASRAARLAGAVERRYLPVGDFELRAEGEHLIKLTGYASVFDAPYDVWGGPAAGGFTESVDRKAFDVTLRSKPDVQLLINHAGMPLARTKSGTLKLGTDRTGLHVDSDLDMRDPDVQRLKAKMDRGDMDEMSFAFRAIRQEWNDDETDRRLTEISIDRGDVSVVNYGANPATSSSLRSLLGVLADDGALAEARSIGREDLEAAHRRLAELLAETRAPAKRTGATMSLAEARALLDGV
jgi:HK97 family phage prohead protease